MKYLLSFLLIIAILNCDAQITTTNKFKPNLTLLTVKENGLKGKVKMLAYSDIYIKENGNSYAETKRTVNNRKDFFNKEGFLDSTQQNFDTAWKTASVNTWKGDTSIQTGVRMYYLNKAVFNKQHEMTQRILGADKNPYISYYTLDKKNRVVKDSNSKNRSTIFLYKENPGKTTLVLIKKSDGGTDTVLTDKENRILREVMTGYSTKGTYDVKEYTYNTNGDISTITNVFFSENKPTPKRTSKREYEYDDHGNWVFMIEYYDGKLPSHVTRRTITYWD